MDDDSTVFRRGVLPVLAGAACISFAAFFVKGSPVNPSAVALYRLLFGTGALFFVAVLSRAKLRPDRQILRIVGVAGLFFAIDLLVWHESILNIGPGIATIVGNFQVIILAFYDTFVLKVPLRPRQYLAIPVALLGLCLLVGLHEGTLPPGIVRGVALSLVSACFYSGYIVTLRRSQCLPNRLPPVSNLALVTLAAAFFVGVFCLAAGVSMGIPDGKALLTVAALGIFCQSFGWLLLSKGLPYLTPFRAGFLMLLQPALSFIWDCLIYGTAAAPVNIFGAVLAIGAIGLGMSGGGGKDGRQRSRK